MGKCLEDAGGGGLLSVILLINPSVSLFAPVPNSEKCVASDWNIWDKCIGNWADTNLQKEKFRGFLEQSVKS